MRALVLLLLLAGRAHAQVGIGVQLHYELATFHDVEDTMPLEARHFVLAGPRLYAFFGNRTFGYHIGVDFAAGSTIDSGGFAYDAALFPIGGAFRFFETSFVTLGIGIGGSGALHTVDDAVTFPIESRFEIGRGIRVLGRVRATWVGAAKARHDGALSTTITDELEAMLALRLGKAYSDLGAPTGNGYFFGAVYRESMGARFVGGIIGYSLDGASARGPRKKPSWDD